MLYFLPKVKNVNYGYGEAGDGFCSVRDEKLPDEGYRITMDADGVKIEYSDDAGRFYAERTLEQARKQCVKLPCAVIEDAPRYRYRGFMIDCARHFFTVAEIKKQINVMAQLKLNKFHWHLTDDQGWRLEIKKYPLLTEVGSRRAGTRGDGKPVEGYYTQEDVREVVEYCAERYIEVVPEIDMPGHFTAAIAAYPHIGCTGEAMKVSEHFGIHRDIVCAGKDEAAEFVRDVLQEVFELFPSRYVHLGGDEALKQRWMDCPDCQKKMAELGLKDEEELQGRFLNEMIAFANACGKTAVLWNDGAMGGNIEGDACVQYWKQSAACTAAAEKMARDGKKVVYSAFSYFYLDYPCGMTPLKKVYNYKINPSLAERIAGLEAPLWAEYIDSVDKLERMAYPRLFAVADRAWADSADYTDFLVRNEVFGSFLKDKYPLNAQRSPNPSFFRGKLDLFKFFVNANDRSIRESWRCIREDKRRWKNKYGSKGKKL